MKTSLTHNNYLKPKLEEYNDSIPVKYAAKILSLNLA